MSSTKHTSARAKPHKSKAHEPGDTSSQFHSQSQSRSQSHTPLAGYMEERAERIRVDAECVALAKAWVERVDLQLPLDDEYVDRFWPLEETDVQIAFLYYFAARERAKPAGSQPFAGLAAGAPHILAKWYPPSFWQHLRERGIENDLRGLPSPTTVPSLDSMMKRLRERYDHQFIYRFYQDRNGNLRWSAYMRGAPLGLRRSESRVSHCREKPGASG